MDRNPPRPLCSIRTPPAPFSPPPSPHPPPLQRFTVAQLDASDTAATIAMCKLHRITRTCSTPLIKGSRPIPHTCTALLLCIQ